MRKYLGIIICFLLAIFFALDKTVLNKNLENPTTARIYIEGTQPKRSIHIEKSDAIFIPSSWCKDCVNTKTKFDENTGHIDIRLSVKQPDTITIMLMGEHFVVGDQKMPLFTTYKNFTVNGEKIFSKFENADTKNYYKYKVNMNAGETMEFSVDVQSPSIFATLKYMTFGFYRFIIALSVLLFLYFVIGKFVGKYEKLQKFDAIFVVIFGFLLFIPMMHISNADKNEQENRTLATKPSLFVDNKINEKYGTQFNDWFNDRFNGRNLLINIFSDYNYYLNNIYQNDKALFIKDNGWMFSKLDFSIPKNEDDIIYNLKTFDNFCKQHNMKLYVLLVPPKELIYSDILTASYGFDAREINTFNKYIQDVKNALPVDRVVYPYDELKVASQEDYVFFKNTHHWADFGAYFGYKALGTRIKKDFNSFNIVSLDEYDKEYSNKIRDEYFRDFNIGSTTKQLNLNTKATEILQTQYTYYNYKHQNDVVEQRGEYTKIFNNKKAKYKLFLIGNSQSENILHFIAPSVGSFYFLRLNHGQQSVKERWKFMKYYKQSLLDFKPDIVVILMGATDFYNVSNFYKD